MGFFTNRWRRIGTRLYLALGFAVFLTLVSSVVGVFYFERSGDLNFEVRTESVPMLESAWSAAREGERIRSLGLVMLGDPNCRFRCTPRTNRSRKSSVAWKKTWPWLEPFPALSSDSQAVYDAAFDLAEVVDNLALNREALRESSVTAAELRSSMWRLPLPMPGQTRAR